MDCDNCNCVNKCANSEVLVADALDSTLSSQLEVLDPDLNSEPILEFEPNTCDLMVSEINIPEKINIDSSNILPSLEELVKDNFTQSEELNTNKNLSAEEMENVMNDIESTVNFTSADEGMHALNNPEILLNRIQNAFNTFKEKTGRNMTYSEMRYMMG
jgi:hypothetical protein